MQYAHFFLGVNEESRLLRILLFVLRQNKQKNSKRNRLFTHELMTNIRTYLLYDEFCGPKLQIYTNFLESVRVSNKALEFFQ